MNGDSRGTAVRRFTGCVGLAACAVAACWTPNALADDDEVAELVGAVCQSCHMIDGNSVVPLFPKLAGQQKHYLESQLEAWREGNRKIEVMDPIRDQVGPRDLEALADYFASRNSVPGVVEDPVLAEADAELAGEGDEVPDGDLGVD